MYNTKRLKTNFPSCDLQYFINKLKCSSFKLIYNYCLGSGVNTDIWIDGSMDIKSISTSFDSKDIAVFMFLFGKKKNRCQNF